ncbi:unnamed protein product, partial [Didymodactylos carnosus]
MWEGACLP